LIRIDIAIQTKKQTPAAIINPAWYIYGKPKNGTTNAATTKIKAT